MAESKPTKFIIFASVLCLTACAYLNGETEKPKTIKQNLVLKPASFADLPGWSADTQSQTLAAFAKSCVDGQKDDPVFGSAQDWRAACSNLPANASDDSARAFFEHNFVPVLATNDGDAQGLFTGYFEASLKGSLTRTGDYQIPLRAKPDDLIMVNLGAFRDEWKGQKIAGRNVGGQLKPYEDRAAIEDGKLPEGEDRALLYVDSAIDAFFLQIQGSGIVTLPDGTVRRVGYNGQNGYPYYAIGKELVKRGYLARSDVTMQSIKAWLAAHPAEGREVMRTNRSYVFFKFTDNGPVGGEGVTLTPGRSLAIDHALIPYGVPVYIAPETPGYNRLMVAQDTGGAIAGAVRGDIFFGYGAEAERLAGPMNAKGRYWFLLPKRTMPRDTK